MHKVDPDAKLMQKVQYPQGISIEIPHFKFRIPKLDT